MPILNYGVLTGHPFSGGLSYPHNPHNPPHYKIQVQPPEEPNILTAFKEQYGKLKGEGGADEKAVALTWVCHLVGDAHQPLHTATLFTRDWPNGDRSATRFSIRVQENSHVISLHQLWDGLILGSQRFQSVRNEAKGLLNRPEFARDQLPELGETAFDNWVKGESFKLAKEVAYQNGELEGSPDKEDDDNVPVLPAGYTRKAKEVAERRIFLAGDRLADLLKKAFE